MEVMNNDMFSQTQTLVGRVGKTRAMGVSDDPMLMSMLSTGFYANPLRTMIQEVMFNAWDAHSMGDCQDTAIDVYINDTTGLIIRDYGPGIPDDDIHAVYGIYGNSTKRLDKRQTGGFGLGSKSPFSYTESFTVTSMCEGAKEMYLISRVSDDADGKPGITPLVSTKTDEHGLMVTIPLEPFDRPKAYNYVKSVLYLSGIKANIHSDHTGNDEIETIHSRQVLPGDYIMDDRNNHGRKVYAVYGGVSYEIVEKDEYTKEFEFIKMISDINNLFIGFAPDSLTPLPNREGLNMSSKTKENIRVGLEMCMEKFQSVFEPLVHAYFRQRFDNYLAGEIEPHFALYHALGLGKGSDRDFLGKFQEQMKPLVPLNTDPTVWEIGIHMLRVKTEAIVDVLTEKRWIHILMQHFVRCYPDHKQLAFKVLKETPSDIMHDAYRGDKAEEIIASCIQPTQMSELYMFELAMGKEYPDDKGHCKPKMRIKMDDKFKEVVRSRVAGRRTPRKFSYSELRLNKGADLNKSHARDRLYDDPNRIWDSSDSKEICQFFISKTVILAKTVSTLNDTSFRTSNAFAKDDRNSGNYHRKGEYLIPAYVIHKRKGGYDRALAILKDMGFNVLEADEPEKAVYRSNGKPRLVIPQYRRINIHSIGWQACEIDPENEDYEIEEDGVPLTEPTHFLYVKTSDLEGYYTTYKKPGKELVTQMLTLHPDIAMVNNQSVADSLIKKGVKPFENTVISWHANMSKKIYRMRNIVRVMKVIEKRIIPISMLHNQTIQGAMGIAKIKVDDLAFWNDMAIINNIDGENYQPLSRTKTAMGTLVSQVWDSDPQKQVVKDAIKKTSVFSENALDTKWKRLLDSSKQEEYAKNISRFIRGV